MLCMNGGALDWNTTWDNVQSLLCFFVFALRKAMPSTALVAKSKQVLCDVLITGSLKTLHSPSGWSSIPPLMTAVVGEADVVTTGVPTFTGDLEASQERQWKSSLKSSLQDWVFFLGWSWSWWWWRWWWWWWWCSSKSGSCIFLEATHQVIQNLINSPDVGTVGPTPHLTNVTLWLSLLCHPLISHDVQ